MWNKPERFYGAGDLHFITCSCYRRQPLLGTTRRRDLFLTVLEQVRRRYRFVVVGYVVMPEHIHLLISEPQEKNPLTVMQALKLGFARRVLAEAKRKRIEKLRYVHCNPVKRGLVTSPELWKWSSFRAYALGEAGPVKVNDWEVLKMKIRPPAAWNQNRKDVGSVAAHFSKSARSGAPPVSLFNDSKRIAL